MSKLYAEVKSETRKTPANLAGHRRITAHIRGWNIGVKIDCQVLPDGKVYIEGWKTGGSHDETRGQSLFQIREGDE